MANKFINELNTIESVEVGDELPIWDSSESDTRKTTVNKLASAITVNLVDEGIPAPPSSNAVAVAVKNADAVLHVAALPTAPNIKNVIYHNTTNGKYYVGDKDNQTTQELGGSGAIFTGTQAEWDALTTAEKNEYSQANITDSSSTVFIPVDTVADGNMNPVTSNAVYEALNPTETTITGTTRTVSVTANTTDWFNAVAPTIPSNKRVVRWFATVNESQARASVGYTTSSTPTGVIVSTSEGGDITIALAAVVVDR